MKRPRSLKERLESLGKIMPVAEEALQRIEELEDFVMSSGPLKKGGSIHRGKMCLVYCGEACDCGLRKYSNGSHSIL